MNDPLRETHRQNARSFDFVPVVQVEIDDSEWQSAHADIDISGNEAAYARLIAELQQLAAERGEVSHKQFRRIMRRYAGDNIPWLSKAKLLSAYKQLCEQGAATFDPEFVTLLQKKPTRSQAGVAVVTVLTKPFPCPGKCIFCPTDVRMPKSYLHDEPGAQRAERHNFDPWAQTTSRIEALAKNGHPTDKIELLILGGTWSSYRRDYQEWFIKRCFDAMNGRDAVDLAEAQLWNVSAEARNVGLVVETRQDHIDVDELRWLRYLGVTKVQVGIQSMDEHVLELNARGHDTQATRDAFRLLRLGGFKIHGHWMPNLLGATLASDRADFVRLWNDPAVRPDELKIYPCMLLDNAELYDYWQRGEYQPYGEDELTDLLVDCFVSTPRYVRLTRVIRDIPTNNVIEGNKKANLRQIAQQRMTKRGQVCHDIRSREIRRDKINWDDLGLRITDYATVGTHEQFLSYETADDRLAGFLRLSLPDLHTPHPLPELADCAMIREVHVYGPVMRLGESSGGEAQHMGVGSRLIDEAKQIARSAGYKRLAVISAIGTQDYYRRHGFELDGLYMTTDL